MIPDLLMGWIFHKILSPLSLSPKLMKLKHINIASNSMELLMDNMNNLHAQ